LDARRAPTSPGLRYGAGLELSGVLGRMMMQGAEVNSMYCMQCGAEVVQGQVFCNKCGQRVAAAATAAPTFAQPLPSSASPPAQIYPGAIPGQPSRIAKHLSTLGIFWIILSVLRAIPGLFMLVLGHTRFPFMMMPIPAHFRSFVAPFLGAIGLAVSAFAIAGIIAGWGLIARAPWARMLAIVLGCISLIHFPLGTALGIYTLWVLVPEGACAEYQRIAQAS